MFATDSWTKGLHNGPKISMFASNKRGVSTKWAKFGAKRGEKGLDECSDVGGRGDKRGGEGKWVKQSISPRSKNVTRTAAGESDNSPVRGAGARTGRTPHLRRGGNWAEERGELARAFLFSPRGFCSFVDRKQHNNAFLLVGLWERVNDIGYLESQKYKRQYDHTRRQIQ